MRKTILLASMTAILVLAFAAVANAAFISGSGGDDAVVGTPKGDNITLRDGDDSASGLGRADFIFGNDGSDTLRGNDGSDLLNGGDGNDVLVGGEGEDELVGSRGDDTIYTGTETEGDKVSDEVQCGAGNDVVFLSGGDHASHNLQQGKCEEINQY